MALRQPLAIAAALFALTLPTTADARLPRPSAPSPAPTIIRAECPYLPDFTFGCYYADSNTIYLDADGSHTYEIDPKAQELMLEHELGHAWINTMLDDGERSAVMRAVGFKRWSEATDQRVADVYAICRTGVEFVTADGWSPRSPRHGRNLCALLSRAGNDLRQDA